MAQTTAMPTPGSTRAANEREYDMRHNVVPRATEAALAALEEYAKHTFVTKAGKEHSRYASDTAVLAMQLLRRLFARNGATQVGVTTTPLVPKIRDEVRALYVLVCELNGVKGTYGQSTVWYNEVLETRVRLEITRRRPRRRAA